MRVIKHIVVHCADTPAGVDFNIDDIRSWHTFERGWRDVGYNFVIRLDGTIEKGRNLEDVPAHVTGYNRNSIGICYIGGKEGDTRTLEQKVSLVYLIGVLKRMFRDAEVLGHRDFPDVQKECPCYDAKTEYKNL